MICPTEDDFVKYVTRSFKRSERSRRAAMKKEIYDSNASIEMVIKNADALYMRTIVDRHREL